MLLPAALLNHYAPMLEEQASSLLGLSAQISARLRKTIWGGHRKEICAQIQVIGARGRLGPGMVVGTPLCQTVLILANKFYVEKASCQPHPMAEGHCHPLLQLPFCFNVEKGPEGSRLDPLGHLLLFPLYHGSPNRVLKGPRTPTPISPGPPFSLPSSS